MSKKDDAPYRLRAIVTDDNEYIAIDRIESINRDWRDPEDKTVDALKNDTTIRVRTVSGKYHIVSLVNLSKMTSKDYDHNEMWDVVFESWMESNV